MDTPVTVKVNVPLDLVEPDLKVTRPVGPVVPVAVPDVSPDHVPVTVAPDSGPPVLDWIVTTAFANVDGFFPVPGVGEELAVAVLGLGGLWFASWGPAAMIAASPIDSAPPPPGVPELPPPVPFSH